MRVFVSYPNLCKIYNVKLFGLSYIRNYGIYKDVIDNMAYLPYIMIEVAIWQNLR